LAATAAASLNLGGLCRYNPFLSPLESDGITCATMLVMMTSNRVSLANNALNQARKLLKLLSLIASQSADNLKSSRDRLIKELNSSAENLATILASRRQYSVQVAPNCYDIDPRFLIFEYCHGLLLRKSQVQLIRKLIADMDNNRSICHQV
jgi:hypothetical protein